MSDKKISQLTAATTPLAGTETLPIVQGGQTVKVSAQSIANLAPAELPSQSGNANKYLQTNGTTASWASVSSGPGFTYASYRYTFSSGSITATELVNNIGFVNTITAASGYIQIDSSGTPFTNNKTFVTATGFRSNSFDMASVGGIEYVSTSTIKIYFSDNGAPYSFTSKTSLYNGTINIQIYP